MGRRKQEAVESFLRGDTLDDLQKKEIADDRNKARTDMEAAVSKREETVNPILVELLKKHYGVDFDASGKGTAKVGATRKSKQDYKADIDRLYEWAQTQEEKKRELAAQHEEQMQEICPFAPSLSNKSRQIYASEKDKIMQKREKRQKEFEEKRQQKLKEDKAKTRNLDSAKDPFSRRLVHKTEKKEDNQEQMGESAEKPRNIKEEKRPNEGGTKKKPSHGHGSDNFHKHMMEWCDKRDKNKTQKTVEHWVNTFENMEHFKGSQAGQRRTKAEQVAHAETLIGTIEKREQALAKQRDLQVKGLFQPKVSQYVPKHDSRSKSKENYESIDGHSLNYVYYTRSPQKEFESSPAKPVEKTQISASPKKAPDSARKAALNLVEVDDQGHEKVSRTLISARE